MKQKTKTLLTIITPILAIIIFISSLLGAGWANRPIVDYYISSIQDNYQYSVYNPLTIALEYRNRGSIDANLNLVLTTINATITVNKVEPWMSVNGTKATFHVVAQMKTENYASITAKILPLENVANFSISYSIVDVSELSIPNGLISHWFLEKTAYYPINANYEKIVNPNAPLAINFQLVT